MNPVVWIMVVNCLAWSCGSIRFPIEEKKTAECPVCLIQFCPKEVQDCQHGFTEDECGCCVEGVCKLLEREKCFFNFTNAENGNFGSCGLDMECNLRMDLKEGDSPEYLCRCKDVTVVCGRNNVTYSSVCEMKEASVELDHWGPCDVLPDIVSGPVDSESFPEQRFVLDCEVKGYPVPAISWQFQAADGLSRLLPGDDPRIVVQSKGGPESYMITSWMEIDSVRETDAGIYTCVAENSKGIVRSAAVLRLASDIEWHQKSSVNQ